MKSCVYPINISQLILLRFTQRDSTLAWGGGGAHLCDGSRWRHGVSSLLLAGAPCFSGSVWGLASIRAGAVMRQGGVRLGRSLIDAPCSSAAAAVKGSQHDGADGVLVEATTMGSRRRRRAL
jgi:hypothetical protein